MGKTHNISLPKGKKATNVNTKIVDGNIEVSYDLEDVFEPKDGDFVVSSTGLIFIFKKDLGDTYWERCAESYIGIDGKIGNISTDLFFVIDKGRFATEQEKQSFLERLKNECGKRWNEETKKLEDIRWRAEENELYYYLIVGHPTIVKNIADTRLLFDDVRYESGNYFRTYEAAKKVADQIKEMFKNSKAE